jgi:hypothetical protein
MEVFKIMPPQNGPYRNFTLSRNFTEMPIPDVSLVLTTFLMRNSIQMCGIKYDLSNIF